jgi:hypothetical protein
MNMSKRILLIVVLAAALLSGCKGGVDSPPLVYLVSNGSLVDGFQGPYCWDKGIQGTLCADPMEPYFDETTRFPASGPLQIQLDEPLPSEVTLSLSKEIFGDEVIAETVPVTENLSWSPPVNAGEYILTVHATWKQGNVSYWFSIILE